MKKQSVLMGSFLLMIAVVVSKAAGLLLKIPLANILGGMGMGYYSSAYAVFMPLYSLCSASLPPAIARYVSESSALGRNDDILLIKKVSLKYFGTAGSIISIIPFLFSGIICERMIGNPEARLSVMAIAPCIFFGTVTAIYRGYYEGMCSMTPTAISQIIDAIVKLVTGLGFAYFCKEYAIKLFLSGDIVFGTVCTSENEAISVALPYISASAILGTTVADLAATVYLWAYSRSHSQKIKKSANKKTSQDAKRILSGLLKLITPVALASLVSGLLSTIDLSTIILLIRLSLRRSPQIYADKYREVILSGISLKELPNFLYGSFSGLSMAIFTLAPSLCSVFGKSALPNISENFAKGNLKCVRWEIRRAIMLSTYISIPAGLGLSAFSLPILKMLFSSRYAEVYVSWEPLAILGLGTVFLSVFSSVCSMLQAVGKMDLPVKISLVGAVIKLILNTVLIPHIGLNGASISTVISYAVICIVSVVDLYRLTGTKAKPLVSIIIPSTLGLTSVLSASIVYHKLTSMISNFTALTLSVGFAVIIYIVSTLFLDICNKNKITTQIFR